MKEPEYRVRPSSGDDQKHVFRIFLSPAQLLFHKLHSGDVCHIVHQSSIRPAIAWLATEKIKDDVVQLSMALQVLYGLTLQSRVSIRRSDVTITVADEVTLCEIPQNGSDPVHPYPDEDERSGWAWLLKHHLSSAKTITPGMTFERVNAADEARSYRILSINSSAVPILYHPHPRCRIHLQDADSGRANSSEDIVIPSEGVAGLDKEIERLNTYVIAYSDSHKPNPAVMPSFRRKLQGGRGSILLHGDQGTGKSMILGKICEAGWRRVYHIDTARENVNTLKHVFTDALACQPSVIILDNLDSSDPARFENYAVNEMSEQLERIHGSQTLAVGATRDLAKFHPYLRKYGLFEAEIEIPIPNSKARAEILKIICEIHKDEAYSILEKIAARTSGYVGADLRLLLEEVERIAAAQESESGVVGLGNQSTDSQAFHDRKEDAFTSSLRKVQTKLPFNLNKIPETKWKDIGGQHESKKLIQKAVRDLKEPDKLMKYGLKPPKGLVLFGPPGCSKTMTARAAATESDLYFIAIKGAEVLNMYVGESERAVREVFKKARAASPSIIFIDEIDAIGAYVHGQSTGIHILTTLLNEIDGLEGLTDVFVLAATNRPEALDPALIRAGRLSTTLYVGLPDLKARQDILQMSGPVTASNDVDLTDLAEKTEGFSGADLVELCQMAGNMALEEDEASETVPIRQKHWNAALAKVQRSVTPEMLTKYEVFAAGRRHFH